MHKKMNSNSPSVLSRRSFLNRATSAAAGAALIQQLPIERVAYGAGGDALRLALVGCGGRGAGAAGQALTADSNVKLVAMADVQEEKLQTGLGALQKAHPGAIDVPPDRQFLGFDGYKQAIAAADVVILATSPGFRPFHFEEAVRQGKHVFMEKPVATDAPGIRRVLAAAEIAKAKNLKVGVGLQRRHQPGYREMVKRLQDGAIGDIIAMRAYWLGNAREGVERKPGETEMQYQIRNWYYFTWLSGDHNVEQHVHNIDVINWIKGSYPVRAQGLGGRQVRTKKIHGQIFDHHFVEYEYADGSVLSSQCRQNPGTYTNISEHVVGTRGQGNMNDGRKGFAITGANPWQLRLKEAEIGHQLEHFDWFDAIRHDKPYNEAETGAKTTLTAIMGRMATYSGKMITWEEALNSRLQLVPDGPIDWNTVPPVQPDQDGWYPVAKAGITKVL